MKIIGIKFKNINSLKGRHEIRLDVPPFTDKNLFAITGNTGSGKTSILDAITLALYGRVPRHDYTKAYECVTRHTGDAYAEVEFEVLNKKYRANWSIKLSGKSKTPSTPKMELADVNSGIILCNHPLNDVKSAIIELTGLDYAQFQRSVMLSQGDFALFLKSKEKDRSELLEKITDTAIYSEISKLVFEKAKRARLILESKQQNNKELLLLSDDELNQILLDLEKSKKVCAQLEQALEVKNKQSIQLSKIADLIAQCTADALQIKLIKKEQEAHQDKFDKLNLHLKAQKHQPLLQEFQQCNRQLSKETERLNDIVIRQTDINNAATENQNRKQKAIEELNLLNKQLEELDPLVVKVRQIDVLLEEKEKQNISNLNKQQEFKTELENIENQILVQKNENTNLLNQLTFLDQWLITHSNEAKLELILPSLALYVKQLEQIQSKRKDPVQNLEKALNQRKIDQHEHDKFSASCADLKQKIENNKLELQRVQTDISKLSGNKNIDQLVTELDELLNLVNLCENQENLAQNFYDLNVKFTEISKDIESHQIQKQSDDLQLTDLTKELELLQNRLALIEENERLQSQIIKYETERNTLKNGTACPLCGSEHHPYTVHQPVNENALSAVQQQVKQLKGEQKEKEIKIQQLRIKCKGHETSLQYLNDDRIKNREEHSKIEAQFIANNQKLPKPLDFNKKHIITQIINNKRELIAQNRKSIQTIKDFDHNYKKFQDLDYALNLELQQAINQTDIRLQHIANIDIRIEDLNKQCKLLDEESFDIQTQIQNCLNEVSYTNAFNLDTLKDLELRASNYKIQIKLQDSSTKQHQLLDQKLKILEQQYNVKVQEQDKFTRDIESQTAELIDLREQRMSYFGTNDPSTVLQQAQNKHNISAQFLNQTELEQHKLEQQLNQLAQEEQVAKGEINNLKDKLIYFNTTALDAIKVDGFVHFADLQQVLLSTVEENLISKQKDQLNTQLSQYEHSLRHSTKNLNDLQQQQTDFITLAEHQDLIEQHKMELNNENETLGRLKERKEQHDRNQQKHSESQIEIAQCKQDVSLWDRLSQIIGSADGSKFRSFAQGLSLDLLKNLANYHLKRLTSRYEIFKTPNKDLELQIIDRYQANSVRPMNTLSGGETFLVSLSLALGLSELASRKTQINSLFIDEGFGSLDQESLDTAISALESLQVEGKTIGIISHIPELKERISAEIHLEKGLGGYSSILMNS